ncbi:hypothetical protein D9M69_254970 [compost metagenome]
MADKGIEHVQHGEAAISVPDGLQAALGADFLNLRGIVGLKRVVPAALVHMAIRCTLVGRLRAEIDCGPGAQRLDPSHEHGIHLVDQVPDIADQGLSAHRRRLARKESHATGVVPTIGHFRMQSEPHRRRQARGFHDSPTDSRTRRAPTRIAALEWRETFDEVGEVGRVGDREAAQDNATMGDDEVIENRPHRFEPCAEACTIL